MSSKRYPEEFRAERHTVMTWAQARGNRRVVTATQASINGAAIRIDIKLCSRCDGSVRVIACIEGQGVINRILTHLRDKEQGTPTLPHLAPPTRAPAEAFTLFAWNGAR